MPPVAGIWQAMSWVISARNLAEINIDINIFIHTLMCMLKRLTIPFTIWDI